MRLWKARDVLDFDVHRSLRRFERHRADLSHRLNVGDGRLSADEIADFVEQRPCVRAAAFRRRRSGRLSARLRNGDIDRRDSAVRNGERLLEVFFIADNENRKLIRMYVLFRDALDV